LSPSAIDWASALSEIRDSDALSNAVVFVFELDWMRPTIFASPVALTLVNNGEASASEL
jgi:hypothetical protein